MSVPENNPDISSSADLDAQNLELRRLVNLLFAGLIVSSFTLTAFLGLQGNRTSKEAAATKAQAQEITQAVQQQEAAIRETYQKLADFGRRHPDFQNQVLSKYKIANPPAK